MQELFELQTKFVLEAQSGNNGHSQFVLLRQHQMSSNNTEISFGFTTSCLLLTSGTKT